MIKDWWKSLFPFRWIFPMIFILLTSGIIAMGFEVPVPKHQINHFQYPILWYGLNVVWWVLVDLLFGLGREGALSKIK